MIIRTSLKMRSQKWMKKQIIEEVKERETSVLIKGDVTMNLVYW